MTTATSSSPVGGYPTSCSGAVDGNYTITYVAGTLTVATLPGAPTITSVTDGADTQLVVAFTAPSDGGSPITSYTATCGSQSNSGPSSPIAVSGLADGTQVPCVVFATNGVGPGPSSSGVDGTPTAAARLPAGVAQFVSHRPSYLSLS
jgi:titin